MIQITYIQAILCIVGSFTAGAVLVALITAAIRRGITVSPQVTVNPPEVVLPADIKVVIQQPPPPPMPMDRAALWNAVYRRTMDELHDEDYHESVASIAARMANEAVETAFPTSS